MKYLQRSLLFLLCLFAAPLYAQTAKLPLQCVGAGSGTAQTCTTILAVTPSSGEAIIFTASTSNTGDVTIAINGGSAKHIKKWLGSSVLASGDLPANQPVLLTFDGTAWEISTIGNVPGGSGSSAFSALTPSTNTSTAGSFIAAPGSAIGGTTANWQFNGASAETNTGAVVQISTPAGSTQGAFEVDVQTTPAFKIVETTGSNQQTWNGYCSTTPAATGDVARFSDCFATAGIVGRRVIALSTIFTGTVFQAETATAAGSGYKLFSGRVGCSADGTCSGGGAAEVFNVLGNGTITLGTPGANAGAVNFYNATSGNVLLTVPTGALGAVVVTIPAATDTLVNLAGTQTLTNKSIAGSEINSSVVGGQFGGTGQNSSASTGVAQVVSGAWSFSTALANGTTATTQSPGDNTTKVATDAFVLANVGGNVVAAAQYALPYYSASGTNNTISGVAAPTVQGQYGCGYFLTTSAAATPSCPQIGFGGGQDLTGSSTALTVAYSDNGQIDRHVKSASGTGAITLPTPTTLNNANFGFKYCNDSPQTDVITPTTLTIQAGTGSAASTLNVIPGICYFITPDPSSPTTNWVADASGSTTSGTVTGATFTGGIVSVSGSTTLAFTVAGTSGGIPYFSSTSAWASSGLLPTGDFVLGGGAGSAPTATFSVVPIANGGINASSAAAGTMPNATSGSAASWTATPTLGASGTLGSITYGNATSGTLTMEPLNAALGTITGDFVWITAAPTTNVLPKFTGVLGAMTGSSLTDNGTVITTAEYLALGTANCTTLGTGGGMCMGEGTGPTVPASTEAIYASSTQHDVQALVNDADYIGVSGTVCANVTPVTVAANVTTDQLLMSCTLAANDLNTTLRTLKIFAAGVYSTAATSTAQITLKAKLCTVSGCGSGTVISLLNIQSTALGSVTVTNNAWNITGEATVQTAGASAAFESHGFISIDLGSLTTAADSIFDDTNTATVGTISSTGGLFLQITGAYSAGSTSNSMTERQLVVEFTN